MRKRRARARGLTQRLTTFAEGGAPIKKPAAIKEMLEEAVTLSLSGSNVKGSFSIPDNVWPVELDANQMSQAIHNLVMNAAQAMPEGGILRVAAENVSLAPEDALPLEPGDYVKMTFEDSGGGIPKEDLEKIFDPFFTTRPKATGLGLSMCYSTVLNHNGHISVESDLGAGTTVTIYLPALEAQRPSERDGSATAAPRPAKVLVMDDEEAVRKVSAKMLGHAGHEVVCVEDGVEAIARYKQAMDSGEPFGAVILDLTVPGGMGGKKTIAELLKLDPDVKAIVSSGYSRDPIMARYKDLGFIGVVVKPYDTDQLTVKVCEALE